MVLGQSVSKYCQIIHLDLIKLHIKYTIAPFIWKKYHCVRNIIHGLSQDQIGYMKCPSRFFN